MSAYIEYTTTVVHAWSRQDPPSGQHLPEIYILLLSIDFLLFLLGLLAMAGLAILSGCHFSRFIGLAGFLSKGFSERTKCLLLFLPSTSHQKENEHHHFPSFLPSSSFSTAFPMVYGMGGYGMLCWEGGRVAGSYRHAKIPSPGQTLHTTIHSICPLFHPVHPSSHMRTHTIRKRESR